MLLVARLTLRIGLVQGINLYDQRGIFSAANPHASNESVTLPGTHFEIFLSWQKLRAILDSGTLDDT